MNRPAGATASLARFVAGVALPSLPDAVVRRVRECLLDFVANTAFGGVEAESSAPFRAAVNRFAAPGDATVLGEARGYPPHLAALLNGAYAHSLDFDDTSLFGALHPGAPVIAAALAAAEAEHASGRALFEAIVAGYEVACRVGAAIGTTAYDRGFHNTPVSGIFGAVAAAGRLAGLDAAGLENAFGLAGSRAAGSMQYLDNGAWNKRLHPGFAAHDALVCVAFAREGVIGARAAVEGRYGLLAGYTNAPQPGLLTDRLGQWWASAEVGLKPYPSCRLTHGAVDAALALRARIPAHALSGQPVHVSLSPKALQIVGERLPNKIHAGNVVEGQFSVYFQVAVALLDGASNWTSYGRLGDADVASLESRITVEPSDEMTMAGARVRVGGAPDWVEQVDVLLGEPENPLPWSALVAKLADLTAAIYGAARVDEIARGVRQLESIGDVRELTALLKGPIA